MRVLLTGSSSHLAQALLPMLCDMPEISGITGVDLKPGNFAHPKFRCTQADLTEADLKPFLHQQDALIHLAFVVLRGKTPVSVMRAINLDASQRLFDTATASGITRIVHLSSASVYGDGENLDEAAPMRPIPGFLYAEHKAELERWLIQNHPQIIRLRPHIILGRHAQPLLINLLRQPCYVKLPDPQPLLQCVHEDDVSRAIIQLLRHPANGAYNLAADEVFSFRDAILRRHRLGLPIPASLAKIALKLACNTAGIGGEAGWIDGVHRSLTLDCSKAKRDLHWQAQVGAWEMLA
jgi:UDP-glucose 4-epimerase